MYAISKLTKESQDFLGSPAATGKTAYIGLAKAIVNTLAVPTADVEDIAEFYIDNLSMNVRDVVGKVNELVIIDTGFVLDTVKALWKARTLCAFPSKAEPIIFPGMCKPNDVYGFGNCLTPEVEQLICDCPLEIMKAYATFSRVISEIQTAQE
jgi:hypothetical protein